MNKKEKILSLYEKGYNVRSIIKLTGISMDLVLFHLGIKSGRDLPRPYLNNDKRRLNKIQELREKENKSYFDIIYMNYLRGELSKDLYYSAFEAII